MKRAWKVPLLLAVILLLGMTVSLGWSEPQKTDTSKMPAFSAKDRELITTYYKKIRGTLAPGSLDRSAFSLGVEQSLVAGSKVPLQLKKELKRLPRELESQLGTIGGAYGRYELGHHVVLIVGDNLTIADILKNVVPK
jgi:hypothetical protein